MATFFMFGKYSSEAMKGISQKRTNAAEDIVKQFGGKIEKIYALLGERDLVVILTIPGVEQAIKVSVALSKMTGIVFTTVPALAVEDFDKLTTGV